MRQIAVREADAAGTVLARAFALDPLWVYLLPDRTQRAFVLRQSFRATVPWYSRNGQVYGVGDPLRGVAVWSVPGQAADSRWSLLNVNTITLLASPLALVFRKAIPIFCPVREDARSLRARSALLPQHDRRCPRSARPGVGLTTDQTGAGAGRSTNAACLH